MLPRFALPILLLICAAAPAMAGDQAPQWLQQAAQMNLPTYDKNVQAVVLVDDGSVTVSPDGRVTKVQNYAIRILQHEARERAITQVAYLLESGKVKDLDAWLISANGNVKQLNLELGGKSSLPCGDLAFQCKKLISYAISRKIQRR